MRNIVRNWKTSLPGLVAILMGFYQIVKEPAVLADPIRSPVVLGQISAGVGLLKAKDSDKSGTVEIPRP